MKKPLFLLGLTFMLAASSGGGTVAGAGTLPPGGGETSFPDLARQFDYDASRPLDVQGRVVAVREGATIYDITYASPSGDRVDAFLVVPTAPGPHPAVLFGHWGEGNRTEFLPEAILCARMGMVSLLPAYPWTRPAPWRRSFRYFAAPDSDRDLSIQAVVDLRRGLDLLLSRPDVDPDRLVYIGHSFGAQWGAILTAVDRRMKATVLIGGVPDAAAIWLESDDPDFVGYRQTMGDAVRRYVEVLSAVDAIRYVPHAAPIPLLFQFARFERYFNEAAMNRYFAAASGPKQVRWYDTGHDLNDPQALRDRTDWVLEQLRRR
jgi:cephalosporin-C deacetylase-like acetyl esterase